MKLILFILTSILLGTGYSGNVSEFNKTKKQAEFAFNDEKYDQAIEKYHYLIDSLKFNDDNARLNLAHSYYKTGNIEEAKARYSSLIQSGDKEVRSIANQQMGVFESRGQNLKKSLDYFKSALIANPKNEEARYNYELIKKKLEEQEKQNQDQEQENKQDQEQKDKDKKEDQDKQNQSQDQKEQEQKDQKDKDQKDQQQNEKEKEEQKEKQQEKEKKEQEKQQDKEEKQDEQSEEKDQSEQEDEIKPKEEEVKPMPNQPNFEDKEISKEMAEMILQAMRNQELQYLQQLKRKPEKPKDKDKPDW